MRLKALFAAGLHNRLMSPAGGEGGEGGAPAGNEGGGKPNGGDSGDNSDSGDGDGDKPSDETAKLLSEVMKKKEKINALTESNSSLEEANKKIMEELESLKTKFDGIDPSEVSEMKQRERERREKELADNQDWETLKAEMEERHQSTIEQALSQKTSEFTSELEAEREKYSALEQKFNQSQSVIEELTVGNAFGTSMYVSEELSPSPTKVRKLYGEHFDVEDGQIVAYDKPRGAEKRQPLVDGNGKPLNFELALQKIVDSDPDKDTIRKAKQRAGSDSSSANRDGSAPKSDVKGLSRIEAGLNQG